MTTHPYACLPDHAFWRRAVARVPPSQVDPVLKAPFAIAPTDRVATAGSCFAQHIARYLRANGLGFLVTETAHPLASPALAAAYGYGQFTARYGNVYTSRQLLQLFQRAYGEFRPAEDAWRAPDGRLVDPFRPTIQPGGFRTEAAYEADRSRHFASVRRAFEELDVFVFTLGLTECWASREDGAAYPVCPGVSGGSFDPAKHGFLNLTVEDVTADLTAFLARLREVNPEARTILTVSPVPLVATAEDRHVLVSTTYSKSVLRVAAETVARSHDSVAYFPSYEIITGNFSRGAYFAEDCRSVLEPGVAHVMRLFLRHYAGIGVADGPALAADADANAAAEDAHTQAMHDLVEVACDEVALDG